MLVFLLISIRINAQDIENGYQTRTSFTFEINPVKKVKLQVSSEIRLDVNFGVDKYNFNTGVEFKPIKFLRVGVNYIFIGNPRNNKVTEYSHRYDFSVTAKKKINRFKPSVRVRFTNYADDESNDNNFLRYKALVKYDIRKSKVFPSVGIEVFQQLSEAQLYKMRYNIGMNYKLDKRNYIDVSYKFDYYLQEYKNRHILSMGYKFKF